MPPSGTTRRLWRSCVDAGPAEKARAYAGQSLAAYHSGDIPRARNLAIQAFDLAQEAGDGSALTVVHNILGILEGSLDRPSEALKHLNESLRLAEDMGNPDARLAALQNLAALHRRLGEIEAARELTAQALVLSRTYGERHREAALNNAMADLMHDAGDAGEAMRYLKQAVAIYAEIGVDSGELRPEVWKLTEW